MDQIFIGRQAIFDRTPHLFGYELLYRGDEINQANFSEGHLASSHVILTTFLDIGLERLVGSNRAFINLTHDFIVGNIHLPVSPEQVVLEIPRDVAITAEVVQGLRHFKERGFTIALHCALLDTMEEELLEQADIIKVDTQAYDRTGLRQVYERLSAYPVKLLAEKIENEELFDFCRSLGFDYFQGYHLHHTQVISGKQLPNNRMVIQQLLAKLQEPQVELADLEELITLDATLSYQLLRYINCASYGMRQEVGSIHQAINLFGLTTIRQWVHLINLKRFTIEQPRELLLLGLKRAHMCECLAADTQTIPIEQAFTVGLFSVLEPMLHTPIDDLLDEIPLSIAVKLALLDHAGPLGDLLSTSERLSQQGEQGAETRSPPALLQQCLHNAQRWAQQQIATLYD